MPGSVVPLAMFKEREHMFISEQTNKGALTAGNKIIGYSSRAALAKDMLVIPLGKNIKIHYNRS